LKSISLLEEVRAFVLGKLEDLALVATPLRQGLAEITITEMSNLQK
jgi:hypothetical protein